MKANVMLAELKRLDSKAHVLRNKLGFSRPEEIIFFASCDEMNDDMVIVEANGFGGATTSVVVGNYPVDYLTKFERFFPTEREAEAAGEKVAFDGVSPIGVLGEPL